MYRCLDRCDISGEVNASLSVMIKPAKVVEQMIVSSGSFNLVTGLSLRSKGRLMKSTFLLILLRMDQLWSSLTNLCGLDPLVVVLAQLSWFLSKDRRITTMKVKPLVKKSPHLLVNLGSVETLHRTNRTNRTNRP